MSNTLQEGKKQGDVSGKGFGVNPQNINRTGDNLVEAFALRDYLIAEARRKDGIYTKAEKMAKRIVDIALDGKPMESLAAIDRFADRTEGKPAQKNEHKLSGTVQITIKKL